MSENRDSADRLIDVDTEGDVEGVMNRPAGNTTDVYAECEKWYIPFFPERTFLRKEKSETEKADLYRDAWFAQRGLSRTEAKRRYISTLIETMHRYASQTPEARELVAELEFVWDQIKANTSSGSESATSSPVRTLGVPPLSPQHQRPPPWQLPPHQQRTYASIGGRLAQQPAAYEDMVAIANANDRPGRGEATSRLRVLSPVSQPDDMYQRRSSGIRNYDEDDGDEDTGSQNRNMDKNEEEEEEQEEDEDEEEEEYEEAQDNLHEDDDNNTQHTTSEDREDHTEASSLQQHHGKNTPPMTPPPSNRKPPPSAKQQSNIRRWRRRVEQALTKMTAEVAAVREQMEGRAIQHRRRSSAWAWIKWLTWVALRQVFWDLAVLAMLLIWMRIKGDRRVEDKLKAGWSELKGRLGRLRFLRRVPRVGTLP